MIKRPRTIACLVLATVSSAASAQEIRYRSNDPFVFCRYGYKEAVAQMCWIPVPPYTGIWMYTGACDPPNKYGRSWNNEDYDALNQYESICPQAVTSGEWKGSGDGTQSPFKH